MNNTSKIVNKQNKRFGQWKVIDDEKIRVVYKSGMESVLIEDIASIEYINTSKPNMLYFGLGWLFFIIIIFFGITLGVSSDDGGLTIGVSMILAGASLLMGVALAYILKMKFDNIIIETRGGKEIIFSVPFGIGYQEMEKIEKVRKKWKS